MPTEALTAGKPSKSAPTSPAQPPAGIGEIPVNPRNPAIDSGLCVLRAGLVFPMNQIIIEVVDRHSRVDDQALGINAR